MIQYPKLERVLKNYCTALTKLFKANVPVATGRLKNSISCRTKRMGEEYNIILNIEDYYYWVDSGRKPSQKNSPPLTDDTVREWIIAKKITFKDKHSNSSNVRDKSKKSGVSVKAKASKKSVNVRKNTDIDRLIFLIKRKIHQEGYRAKPFIDRVVKDVHAKYEQLIYQALSDDISDQIEKNIKKITK